MKMNCRGCRFPLRTNFRGGAGIWLLLCVRGAGCSGRGDRGQGGQEQPGAARLALPWPPKRTASGASGWRPRVKERGGNVAHQQHGGAHGEAGGRRWGDACVRARQATAMADGRADARTEARMQRGRRGKELSSGIASSPGTRWSRRHGPGMTDGGGIAPASGGSGGGSRGRRRRTGRPRLDSVGEEEAEDVAELVTATASCGAAGGNGMVRRPADGARAQFRFPVRESRGEVRRRAAGRWRL